MTQVASSPNDYAATCVSNAGPGLGQGRAAAAMRATYRVGKMGARSRQSWTRPSARGKSAQQQSQRHLTEAARARHRPPQGRGARGPPTPTLPFTGRMTGRRARTAIRSKLQRRQARAPDRGRWFGAVAMALLARQRDAIGACVMATTLGAPTGAGRVVVSPSGRETGSAAITAPPDRGSLRAPSPPARQGRAWAASADFTVYRADDGAARAALRNGKAPSANITTTLPGRR